MALTKLSNDTLKKIGLDADLYEAVTAYKKNHIQRRAQTAGAIYRQADARYRSRAYRGVSCQAARRRCGAQCLFATCGTGARTAVGRRRCVDAVYVGFSTCGRGQAEDAHPQYQKRAGAKQTAEKFPRPVSRIENRYGKPRRNRGSLGIFSDGIRRYSDWRIKCCSVKRPPPFWRQP